MKHRVQTRLLLVFGILVTSILLVIFSIVWQVTRDNFQKQVSDQLLYTGNSLTRQYSQNSQSIMRETQLISRDYGFRSAVSSGDENTIISALANIQQRINLDRMQVYSVDGQLLADTSADRQHAAILRNMGNRPLTANIMLGNVAYHIALSPVMAPDLIGWIVGGTRIDDVLANMHKKLLPGNPEISFFTHDNNGDVKLLGTSLELKTMQMAVDQYVHAPEKEQQTTFDGEQFLVRSYKLGELTSGQDLISFVFVSLNSAYSYLEKISRYFILTGIFALLLVVASAFLISRSFSRPIHQLANAATSIENGDYSIQMPNDRTDEFGFLAKSFSRMAIAIDHREHRIKEQGMQDTLTGLHNRLYIEDWLSNHLSTNHKHNSVSVVLVSIDRLDEVNYVLGHDVADHVITEVGSKLKAILRSKDIISRMGTDTFGLAISGMQPDEVILVVKRILELFKTPVGVDNYSIDVTGHLGIAVYPDHADTARDLLRAAEHALFIAHSFHERYSYYTPGRDSTSSEHLSLMGELRSAIDHNELEVWYQPQVATEDGEFSRVEALVRWPHPDRGMISPETFIPLAERTGEINRLTHWVLENSLMQIADWRARGLAFQVSVNLSARDLMNRQLPTVISVLLRKYGVRPDSLCIEITESAIMSNMESDISVLQVLRDTGIQIAIDDYGTGYSSLEYLARLPVTELKIDQAFIKNLSKESSDQVIVKSVIGLAQGLGLTVVSEGVEDARAARMLHDYGCDLLQGYFICKPKPAAELEIWFDSYQARTRTNPGSMVKTHGAHKKRS